MSEISGKEANIGESEDRLLERNLSSARLLIAYLAHNHREAPADLVNRVTEAYRTPREDWDSAREAQFWLDLNAAVVEYVLPLLLGLLGAIVFVLREISREIRAKIFLPNHTESYRIRLYLGMIAGLTFAWLFSWIIPAGSESGLGAASPLAIAFMVGYSVEILFSALDRIIGSMTKKKETEKTDPTVTSV
jgi:hypothetical protein